MSRLALAALVALGVSLAAGCGKPSDDCQKMFDKLMPIMEQSAGSQMSVEDRAKALSECRDGLPAHQNAALMKCVIAAADDAAVHACLDAPVHGRAVAK